MDNTSDYLFVYGSLKRSFAHAMQQHIRAYATFVSEGYFQGKLYRIDWYPGVIDSSDTNDRVKGEIYRLQCPTKLLELLDRFESYTPDQPETCEYLRVTRPIISITGSILDCQIYLYNRPLVNEQQIQSGIFE